MAIKIKKDEEKLHPFIYRITDTSSDEYLLLTKQELISLHTKIGKMLKIKSYQDFVDEVEEDKRKFLGGFGGKK